jgi:hypothetical protein
MDEQRKRAYLQRQRESCERWEWFNDQLQWKGAASAEGRTLYDDDDLLLVFRWLLPRTVCGAPARPPVPPRPVSAAVVPFPAKDAEAK